MRADGSSGKALSFTTSGPVYGPSISPYANNIAYQAGGSLYYVPLPGGTSTLIHSGTGSGGTSWEPNNSTVVFCSGNSSGYLNLFSVPISGGTPTNLTPGGLQTTGGWSQPSCSSDGVSIAAKYIGLSSSTSQVMVVAPASNIFYPITPQGYSDSSPSFSPDGTEIAFYRSSAGGATAGIYISDYAGLHQRLLYADPLSAATVQSLAWSPFPYTQLMLGANANLYNGNVDGFLLSQAGTQYGGVCGFTTTTPSTATITNQTSTSTGAPLVFTLSGDNITMIEYSNSFFSLHGETLIQPTGTNPSALVTVDPYTGGIDTVGVAASIVAKASSKVSGGNLAYTAKFTAIYDKTGKNIAPSGAKQIVVNSTTGKLVSFQ